MQKTQRVVVDLVPDRAHQLDDALGHLVSGRGLAPDHAHARHHLGLFRAVGHLLDLVVAVNDPEHVQQLPLVLVDALDLHVEHGVRGHLDARPPEDFGRGLGLGRLLDRAPLGLQLRVVGQRPERRQQVEVCDPGLVPAQRLRDHAAQRRVAEGQPPALRHPVGLVLELPRPQVVKVAEDGLFDDLRVDSRHAVDRVRGHAGQVGHPHQLLARPVLLDDGHAPDAVPVVAVALAHLLQEAPVDVVDDLHVPGQQPLHQADGPPLERLGQHGVVGEGKGARAQVPRLGPAEAVVVHEHAHELGDGDGRVRVVELEGVLLFCK